MLHRITPYRDEFTSAGLIDYAGSVEYFIGRGLEGLGARPGARHAYRRAIERNQAAGVVPWRLRAEQRLAALTPEP
jgi:hypothetical protein